MFFGDTALLSSPYFSNPTADLFMDDSLAQWLQPSWQKIDNNFVNT